MAETPSKCRCKNLEEEIEKIKIRLNALEEVISAQKLCFAGLDKFTIKPQDESASLGCLVSSKQKDKEAQQDVPYRDPSVQQERQAEGGNEIEKSISEDIDVSSNGKDLTMKQLANNESAPIVSHSLGEIPDEPDGQLEKLQMFRTQILDEVIVTSHIIKLMDLGTDDIDQINAKSSQMEKTAELLIAIERRIIGGCQKAYKTFQMILGGLHPELFKAMSGREPSKEERDCCIQPFRKGLMKKLEEKTEHGTDTRVDLPQDLDENFVQLRVVHNSQKIKHIEEENTSLYSDYQWQIQKQIYEPSNIHVKEILKEGNGEIIKGVRSVIIGRAGIGKTTTVQWLSRQWALGEWAQNMVLCFVIQLRVLFACAPQSMTLHQLLSKESTCSVEDYDLPENWLRNNQGKGMLVMVDGLDEIGKMLTHLNSVDQAKSVIDVATKTDPKRLMFNLIQGKILPHCTLICTSRPFLDLANLLNNCKMYEILGLTKEGVKEYVHKKFPEKSKEIESILVQNPVLLSVCSITFYCTQITKHLNNDRNFTEDEVATYTRLQCYILKQYASRRDADQESQIDDKYYFHKLAKLAYKGIFECNLVNNLPKIVFTPDDLWEVGLTTKEVKKSFDKGILTCRGPCYEFFHLSAQELLSCIYILTFRDIDQEIMNTIFEKLSVDGSLNMTLLYLFGVCFDTKDKAIMDYFPNIRGLSEHTTFVQKKLWGFLDELIQYANTYYECQTVLPLCQIAQEAQLPDIADHVVETVVRDGEIHFERQNLTALDIKALLFTCQSSNSLKRIELSQCNLDDTSVKQIAKYLISNSRVSSLDLSGNQIQRTGLEALGEMLAVNDRLLILQLMKNQIKDEDAKMLVEGLSKNKTLRQLSLNENLISDVTAEGIAKCITGSFSWERIDLRCNLIGPKGAQALIDNSTHLKPKSILLDRNRIDNNQFDAHIKAIDFGKPSLESHIRFSELYHPSKVNLDGLHLQDSDIEKVTRILSGKQNLHELSMCNNPGLTNNSFSKLAQLASACPNLKNINLQGSGIDVQKENTILQSLLAIELSKSQIELYEDDRSLSVAKTQARIMRNDYGAVLKIGYKMTETTIEDVRSFANLIHVNRLERKHISNLSLLLTAVGGWQSLTCLAIDRYANPELVVGNIASSLKGLMMSLRVLKLHHIEIDEHDSILPLPLFENDNSEGNDSKIPLTTLDVVNMQLSYGDFKAITQGLKSNCNLKHLRLLMRFQSPENYCEELGAALSENVVLQSLSLGRSSVSREGIAHICKGLLSNNTLQHLDLGKCVFMGDGIVEVINLIKFSSSLISINVSQSLINIEAKYLKDALRRAKHLKYMGLPGMYEHPPCQDMVKGVWDAIAKRGIKTLPEVTPHALMFPDSPKGFH